MTTQKQRDLFRRGIHATILQSGGERIDDNFYSNLYTVDTAAGILSILLPNTDNPGWLGEVHCQFQFPGLAAGIVDSNPRSGKWNFHYSSDYSPEEAISAFATQLRMATDTVFELALT